MELLKKNQESILYLDQHNAEQGKHNNGPKITQLK